MKHKNIYFGRFRDTKLIQEKAFMLGIALNEILFKQILLKVILFKSFSCFIDKFSIFLLFLNERFKDITI